MINLIFHSIADNMIRTIIVIALIIIGTWMLAASVSVLPIILYLAAIALVAPIIISILQRWRYSKIKKESEARAQLILRNGGPQTLEDYLFLFPGACPNCGSRELELSDLTKTSSHYADPHDIYEVGPYTYSITVETCTKCKHSFQDRPSAGRIGSPYLSIEVADSIPEFPYRPNNE